METADHSLLHGLATIVGEGQVLVDPADTASYYEDWRGRYHGRALAVLRPGTREEVAAVVARCAAAQVAIVPQGGNTGLCGGATPQGTRPEVVLSLARLNRLREIDVANATLTVEAGMTLFAVQEAAAEAGLRFALSLAAEGSAQIGGNLSTNAGGTAVLRYGNARQQVLGLEVVLPDGRIWHGLRALRKDNTGYDLKHLFIGAEGTLGIITAAVLQLQPRPKASATAWVAVADAGAAVHLLMRLRDALGERLSAFELVARVCVELVLEHLPETRDPLPGFPWYVLVEVQDSLAAGGLPELLEAALGESVTAGDALDALIAQSQAQAASFWRLREAISEAQKREGFSIKHDVSLPVSRLPEFLDRAGEAVASAFPGVRVVAFGHLGDGNLHYNLAMPRRADNAALIDATPQANRLVHDLVAALSGSISAEHGLGQLKREEIRRYKSALELELMARIKRALDPQGIMNPGKVL
ncbi:MAG: FAD-binding oxidoreductase [Betaproteobacteria bacterium]|jgi:FAD/FMN-containing dehydrogenase|nr:FAD-binding oxidoreductase [Betaproteobacteria bacterium]